MHMKIYHADCTGVQGNCLYPHEAELTDEEALRRALCYDYVCVEYKDGYRSGANFVRSNCLGMDVDNDHSDNPDEWITPDHIAEAFPGVTFAVHYSRSHMKAKRGKAARPKFHVLFLIDEITDTVEYAALKHKLQSVYPYFDPNALDSARFFFGTVDAQAKLYPGTMTLTAYLGECEEDDEALNDLFLGRITEGSRNKTLSHFAGRVLKRFGDTEGAYKAFLERAEMCDPPLDDAELKTIWRSAQGFYQRVSKEEGYIEPLHWNADKSGKYMYQPDDPSDVGQARVLAKYFSDELRYSPATDYIRYDGKCWQETKPGAQAVAHAMTDLQLEEANRALASAITILVNTGAQALLRQNSRKKAEEMMNEVQKRAYDEYISAEEYKVFVLKRRESKYVTATLKEARPTLEIAPHLLDKDWFLLCTPEGTYDLRKGLDGLREHDPDDFITKMTAYAPSDKGMDIWLDALQTIFCGDNDLIRYVKRVAGVVCVGQVFNEEMIISYGMGRNGKSTIWNTVARVMGSYSGNISADSLTMNCKRNVKPEMAETKGKRLLIASELEEGTRLNTSMVKQLCSTDPIFAEKKYKDPFSFVPSHTLVLYTNHLPKVGAMDTGIWRRLIVIPFKAKIEGKSDIKNYTEYLCENAGEAIMKWMIEGAKEAIELGFDLPRPKCVQDAIAAYRAENDWLGHFLEDCCDIIRDSKARSGELYSAYRNYSSANGEYVRSTTDFYSALEANGYTRHRTKAGSVVLGLTLKTDTQEIPDFLN